MTTNIVTASLFGLLAAAATLVPVETSARASAIAMARPMGPRIAPTVRPLAHKPPPIGAPMRPLVHVPHAPHVPLIKDPRPHAFQVPPRRHRQFGFGLPITVLDGSAFYGTTYDPADDVAPYQTYVQPPYPNPAIVAYPPVPDASPLVAEPRQCRAQVQTVPKHGGGRQTITIVRC